MSDVKRPRIWICDDSPTEAAITERSLGPDYEFEKFADGAIVVEKLARTQERPDVLLCDWVMPNMTGDEVCKFLRSNPDTRELPVILVTASRVETADVVAGLKAGADDYVSRPFAPEELRARVDAVLRASKMRESAARERHRLDTLNRIGRSFLATESSVDAILDQLAVALTASLCDGCSIQLLPGVFPVTSISRHTHDATGAALTAISSLADPVVHGFASSDRARAALPPAYWPYIERFGLSGLAILPFPVIEPLQGVVTVTRDGGNVAFEPEDIATIETCIEYAALAVKTALRFDTERMARDQLHAVLEHLPLGIVSTDAVGQVSFVNTVASELLPGAAKAKNLYDALQLAHWKTPGGDLVTADGLLQDHALYANRTTRSELCMTVGDTTRTVMVSTVPLRDAHEQLAGSVTALEDVTSERAIAAERHAIGQYQQQMLGIVGHDLRNPLSAMAVGVALLDEIGKDAPKVPSVARKLASSVKRMSRIVEQLLDVTRARLGEGIPMQPVETQLVPLARAAVEELAMAYPNTKFELRDGHEIDGVWDPDRLSQVLSNLMSNAAQYGRPGTPVVLTLAATDTTATIEVANQNRDKPIPPELIDVLFDPYKRGRDEKRVSGLGLGLYIVHEIVEAHHGSIAVTSDDTGTTFTVSLPRRRASR